MSVKVFFIGNVLGGDDGIGPYLYRELKDDKKLSNFELLELGVVGVDLINHVEDDDKIIIVDAVHSADDVGKVVLLGEKDLPNDVSVVSQHDFGVEQTAKILRIYKPNLKNIDLIGVKVRNIQAYSDKLSDELMDKIDNIKEDVVNNILKLAK